MGKQRNTPAGVSIRVVVSIIKLKIMISHFGVSDRGCANVNERDRGCANPTSDEKSEDGGDAGAEGLEQENVLLSQA